MSETKDQNEAACGGSALTAELGTAVIVDGKVVAWFDDFDEDAVDWCRRNHYGRWLAWRARAPEIVPITAEEMERVEDEAAKMAELFSALPEVPNACGEPGLTD